MKTINKHLIVAMTLPLLASVFYFEVFDGQILAQILYLAAKIFILIFPLLFIKQLSPFKKVFKFDIKELVLGAIIGMAIFGLGFLLIKLPAIAEIVMSAAPFVQSKINSFGVMEHYLLMALVISFVHSMLEEYYWRWFVYGESKKLILSAGAFSLHHFVVLNYYFDVWAALVLTLIVAMGGVLFNLLYARKENIWGAWAAHVGADLFIFYVGGLLIW